MSRIDVTIQCTEPGCYEKDICCGNLDGNGYGDSKCKAHCDGREHLGAEGMKPPGLPRDGCIELARKCQREIYGGDQLEYRPNHDVIRFMRTAFAAGCAAQRKVDDENLAFVLLSDSGLNHAIRERILRRMNIDPQTGERSPEQPTNGKIGKRRDKCECVDTKDGVDSTMCHRHGEQPTTGEAERYDCPIHGEGDGRDCPRC